MRATPSRRLVLAALAAGALALPLVGGTAAGASAAPKCTRAAVKAALGSSVRAVDSVSCQGGFAAGTATTRGAGGYDYNHVVRARGTRWVRSSCAVRGLPARLHKLACTSS
jgi:hypothetical protein